MSIKFPQNVSTYDLLSQAVGVAAKTIQRWKNDPRYSASAPRTNPDGTHNVKAWETFMRAHGLGGVDDEPAGKVVTGLAIEGVPDGTESDWRKAKLAREVRALEIRNGVSEGTLIVGAALEQPLGAFLTAIQNSLTHFPDRAAQRVQGLTDVHEIADILREEVEGRQSLLGSFNPDDIAREIAVALPWDDESARLLGLVTFEGQDRKALGKLIAAGILRALQRIGGAAIQSALNPAAPVAELPAEPLPE